MAWENVSCSECGNEYQVQMYGPHSTRDWKVNNWRGVCDGCKEEAKMLLIEQNKTGELPELTGSDKQIAWAMTIRDSFVSEIKKTDIKSKWFKAIVRFKNETGIEIDQRAIDAGLSLVLEETKAHWWIDNRITRKKDILFDAIKKLAQESAPSIIHGIQADVEAEAVMRPAGTPLTETIADIKPTGTHIEISFPEKRESFKAVIKAYGYRWDCTWKKQMSYKTENPADRVAEIGAQLLAAGFCIRVINPEIREKIKTGNFEFEHTRWIGVLTNKPKHFYVSWSYEDNMYDAAKKITGSKYDKPGVVVPMVQFEEVLDFAGLYKYKLSPAAALLVETAKASKAAALVVDIQEKKTSILPAAQEGIPTLEVPENVEIADEFKD